MSDNEELNRIMDRVDTKLAILENGINENFLSVENRVADLTRNVSDMRVELARISTVLEKVNSNEEKCRANELVGVTQREQIRSLEKNQGKIIGTVAFVVITFAGAIISRLMKLI